MPNYSVSLILSHTFTIRHDAIQKLFRGNAELKKLNHAHIFYYPYLEDNGFDLDTIQPGLQHIAMHYKTDAVLKRHLKDLGDVYLQTGGALIHGDYYPGSWLKTKSGIKIIDPEFSHLGSPEFDIGVMMANLKMARLEHKLKQVWDHYKVPAVFSVPLMLRFCGAEIMRRVIGLAQLPLHLRLQEKSEILELAAQLIQNPKEHLLFQD